jgi:hypothetical protein
MTGLLTFRVLRWAALAAVAPVLWACNSRSLERPIVTPEQTFAKNFQQSINRNVDLLFLVDDSSSMTLSQNNLRTNFPRFINRLMDPPPLPNVHIAVISSDMGVSTGTWDESCGNAGGKNGNFQYHPNPLNPPDPTLCTTNLAAGATFITDDGKGQTNYTGNLTDVFTCIAALGENGCGFEHQFAAILRALGADGPPPPTDNKNFLRKDAYLVVIMITNEDDCSASPGVELYDTNSNTNIASVLGPNDFRCNEFGHLCTDPSRVVGRPKRSPPNQDVMATVTYTDCHSDDADAYLLRTTDVANALKGLKHDASQVLVAAITGPVNPYTVIWKAPTSTDASCGAASCPWPDIAHSCMATDGSFADPAPRIIDFVNLFGANGLVLPVCETDFSPSLDKIAALINAALQPPCITGTVANKAGTTEPDCTVVSHTADSNGIFHDSTVPWCGPTGGTSPCWRLIAPTMQAMNCGAGNQIVDPAMLMDPANTTGASQNATVNCALCIPGTPDPDRGCP